MNTKETTRGDSRRVVNFWSMDPLRIGEGAALPMIPDSWRYSFFEQNGELCFSSRDKGQFVLYEAVRAVLAASQAVQAQPVIPEGYRLLKDTTPEERSYEGGNYYCMCAACLRQFAGPKREVTCRSCREATAPTPPKD